MTDTPAIRPFIVDCDTGRDDALALWLALARGMNLAGVVASYGNTPLANVADNTARVLALAGAHDIPLFAGAEKPLKPHAGWERIVLPRQAASGNGLCNIILPPSKNAPPVPQSAEALAGELERLAREKGRLDYVIMGPATNFAAVCAFLGGRVHDIVARVTMMGGKMDVLWENMPGADFNIACDPGAVRQILAHGYETRFVPMDATWPVVMTLAEIEALRPATKLAEAAQNIMIAHCRHFAPEPVFRFHDPSVIMALEAPELFAPLSVTVNAPDHETEAGRLVPTPDGVAASFFQPSDEWRQETLVVMLDAWELARG